MELFHALYMTREDQNIGGALLESPMRTAMHGKSYVLSAIYLLTIMNKISARVSHQLQ